MTELVDDAIGEGAALVGRRRAKQCPALLYGVTVVADVPDDARLLRRSRRMSQ